MKNLLKSEFGEDGYSEQEKAIIIGLGFKFDEKNNIIDPQDVQDSIRRKLGTRNANATMSYWGIDAMSQEQAERVYGMLSSGEINANTSGQTVYNLLNSNLSQNATKEQASAYNTSLKNLRNNTEQFNPTGFIATNTFDKTTASKEVANAFSEAPQIVRNAILSGWEQASEAIEDFEESSGLNFADIYTSNGDVDMSEWTQKAKDAYENAIDELEKANKTIGISFDSAQLEAQTTILKKEMEEAFGNIDLGQDGIISDFNELKTVIDDMVSSFDKLNTVQKEYAQNGRLSVQTTVDLLAADMSYIDVLEVTKNGIELNAQAEDILMRKKPRL